MRIYVCSCSRCLQLVPSWEILKQWTKRWYLQFQSIASLRYTLNTDKESVPVCIFCIPGTYSTAPGYCVREIYPVRSEVKRVEGLFKARLQASFLNRLTIFHLTEGKFMGVDFFNLGIKCVKKAFKICLVFWWLLIRFKAFCLWFSGSFDCTYCDAGSYSSGLGIPISIQVVTICAVFSSDSKQLNI